MTTPPTKRPSVGFILGKSGAYAVLIVGLVATLLPFFYIMVSSLKTPAELRQTPPDFSSKTPSLNYYTTILQDKDIPLAQNLFNSIFVSLSRVVITLFTSSFAGYIFAKYHFKGKNLAFGVILIQIMIPFQVVMIPNYLLVVKLHLIDSLWALIIPAFVDAYGIFMMKQFIEAMPAELMDAARMDGASAWQEFWLIVVPLLRRTVLLTTVLTVMSSLQVFVIFQLLTRGGPQKQTQTMILSIYDNAFRFANNLGLSAAMSMILFIIILVLTVVQFRILRTEWEY